MGLGVLSLTGLGVPSFGLSTCAGKLCAAALLWPALTPADWLSVLSEGSSTSGPVMAMAALDRRVSALVGLAGGCFLGLGVADFLAGLGVASLFLAVGALLGHPGLSICAGLCVPSPPSRLCVLAFRPGLSVCAVSLDLGFLRLGLGVADLLVGLGVTSRLLAVEAVLVRPGMSLCVGLCVPASCSGLGVPAFRPGLGVCVVSLDLGFLRLGLGVADFLLGLGVASLLLAVEALLEGPGTSIPSGLGVLAFRLGLGVCVLSLDFGILRPGLGVAKFLESRCFATLLSGLQHTSCFLRLCVVTGSSLAARAFRAFDVGSLALASKPPLLVPTCSGETGVGRDGGTEPPLRSDLLTGLVASPCKSLSLTAHLCLSRRL